MSSPEKRRPLRTKKIETEPKLEDCSTKQKELSLSCTAKEAILKIRQYKTIKGVADYIQGETRITVIKAAEIKKRQLSE